MCGAGQGSRSPSRMKKSVVPKRSVATLIAEKADGQNLSTILTSPISENVTKSNSDAGHSLNTVSTTSGNSGFTGDALLDEKFLLSKLGHSQMDIYLSPEDLVQKLLFAAVAGNGEERVRLGCHRCAIQLKTLPSADEEYIASFLIVYRRFETPYK